SLRRVVTVYNGRKPHKDRRLLFGIGKNFCPCIFTYRVISQLAITFEITMGSGASCMHHPFRNTLPVKMGHLFEKLVIFHRGWTSVAHGTRTLVVIHRMSLPGG